MYKQKRPAFTLIEILISIAIIAILSVMVIVALKPKEILDDANRTGDDLKIQMLEGALRQYYFKYDQYPPGLSETPVTICSPGTVGFCLPLDEELSNPIDGSKYFLPGIPQSPLFSAPDSGFEVSLDGNKVKVAYKGETVANQCIVSLPRAYNFDGVDDFLSAPNNSSFNPTTAITLSSWIKPTAITTTNNWDRIVAKGRNTQYELAVTTYAGRGLLARMRVGGVDTILYSNHLIPIGLWSHVIMTYDGANIKLYVDGIEVATRAATGAINTTTSNLTVGNWDNGTRPFDGNMSDVRIYNRALLASEIDNIYNFGSSGSNPGTANLVAQYKMNDADRTVAYDSSGNGNHGTKVGTTYTSFHYQGSDIPLNSLTEYGFGNYTEVNNNAQLLIPAADLVGKDNSTLSFDITTTDRQFVLFTANSNNPYLLVSDDAGTSTVHDNGTDFERITIDGVEFAGTRDALDARIADGETHSVVVEGIDFTFRTRWAQEGLYAGGYTNSSWYFTGRIENIELDGVAYNHYIPRDESDIENDVLGNELECVGTGEAQIPTYIATTSIVATTPNAGETGTDGLFTISLDSTNTSGVPITVYYTISGDASNGNDYNLISNAAVIPNGQSAVTVPIEVINDNLVESTESVTLTLNNTTNPNVTIDGGSNNAAITITSEDTVFAATTSIVTTTNASEPSTNGVFTVSLDTINTSGSPITVNYTVGGNATNGGDYANIGTFVVIPSGQSSATISVNTAEDSLLEGDELITVTLTSTDSPSVAIDSGANQSNMTLTDDDTTLVAIDTPDPSAGEPDNDGQYSVTLGKVNNTGSPIVVNYTIAGSASNGADYNAIGTSVSILDGQMGTTIDIDVTDDSDDDEGGEDVILTLTSTNNTAVTVDSNSASDTVNIADDDANASTYVASLDGDNDYINVNTLAGDLASKNGYTVSGRFKSSATSLSSLWGHNTSGGSNQVVLMLNGSSNVGDLRLYVVNGYYLTINGSYNDNQWHDFSFTVNSGGNSSLTVDGTTVTNSIPSLNFNTSDQINIGMELDGGPSQTDFYKGLLGRYVVTDNSSTIANLLIDEGTGTAINDSSGNNNNGTANNITESTFWVDENYQPTYVAHFDGNNDYIDTGVDSNLAALSGNRTFFAVVNPDSVDGSSALKYRIMTQSNGGSTRFSLGIDDSKPAFYFRDNSGNLVKGNTTLVPGTTYSLALVYDDTGNNIKLYVNGVLDTTETGVGTLSSTNSTHIQIGRQNNNQNRLYDGILYSAQTFSSALSASDVLALHNGSYAGSRVFHYELNEGAGTTINDASGNSRNGTAQNIDPSTFWELVPPTNIISDGLIARWTFDDNALDSVGSNNGTLSNGASYSTSIPANAINSTKSIDLDGDNDFVELGSINGGHALNMGGSDLTISMWMYQVSGGDDYQRMFDKSNGGSAANGYALFARPGNRNLYLSIDGSSILTGNAVYSSSTWHHVAVTFQHSTRQTKFYVDGSLIHTATHSKTIPNDTTNARIGTWNHSTGREFEGRLDDVRIYDAVLDDSDIADIAAGNG